MRTARFTEAVPGRERTMEPVYLLGVFATPVRRYGDHGFKDLVREACVGALRDAGIEDHPQVDSAYFGNCLMDY